MHGVCDGTTGCDPSLKSCKSSCILRAVLPDRRPRGKGSRCTRNTIECLIGQVGGKLETHIVVF